MCFGTQAKVLKHQRHVNQCGSLGNGITIIRQSNDSVFFRSPLTSNNWELLYCYGALPGQSWTFDIKHFDSSIQTFTVNVDSINSKTVNSISLKYLKVTYITGTYSYTSTITERFGDEFFLFNIYPKQAPSCDFWFIKGALCYQDSAFGIKQFTSLPCNYSNVGINELTENSIIKVFPNPVSSILNISSGFNELRNSRIEIINYLGQTVLKTAFNSEIDVSKLPEGCYNFNIITQNKVVYHSIFIKE